MVLVLHLQEVQVRSIEEWHETETEALGDAGVLLVTPVQQKHEAEEELDDAEPGVEEVGGASARPPPFSSLV